MCTFEKIKEKIPLASEIFLNALGEFPWPVYRKKCKIVVINFWSEQVLLEYKTVRAYFLVQTYFYKIFVQKNDLKDVITTTGYICM